MENNEIKDSGILGYFELDEIEDLRKQLEEKDEKIKELQEEIDELEDANDDYERELLDVENIISKYEEDFDKDMIVNDTLVCLATHMTKDGILTPELEEWLDNFGRFYADEI